MLSFKNAVSDKERTMSEVIDFTRKLQTTKGVSVQIIQTDSKGTSSPVIGVVKGVPFPVMWNEYGVADDNNKDIGDLEYCPPRNKFYVVVSDDGCIVMDEPPTHSIGALLHLTVDPDNEVVHIETVGSVTIKRDGKIPVILKQRNDVAEKTQGGLVASFMNSQKHSPTRSVLDSLLEDDLE